MHGMEAGLAALFAGDRDLPLVTAHVVDELGEKDGGAEGEGERGTGTGERERESSRQAEGKMRRRCRVANTKFVNDSKMGTNVAIFPIS